VGPETGVDVVAKRDVVTVVGTTVTNRYEVYDEIRRIMNIGIACYY
jgi:hypothetical protein